MLWPVLLRVAVAFPVPEAPPAQVEAVDAIRALVVYVLLLRGGKADKTVNYSQGWLAKAID